MKLSRNTFIFGASLASLMLSYSAAHAAGIWDGTIGDFDVATNWDNDVVPGVMNIDVSNGGTIQVTTNHTTNDILAGTGAGTTGTWNQSAGTVVMSGGWFRLGLASGATGNYNLTGGSLTTVGRQDIGEAAGGTGNVSVSGGTWTNNGAALAVGGNSNASAGGTGTLNLSAGGTIANNNELWVGVGTGSVGTMNVSGGTINQAQWIAVGRSGGTGTLNMSGGTLNKTVNGGSASIIGASGTGTFNQTGGLFNIASGETWIGETTTGSWVMSGGTATLQALFLGQNGGGNGTLTLQNAASGLTGALTNGGGAESITATTMILGNNATATGKVNLDGGTLAVNSVAKGTGTGTFNFNGGTLRARINTGTFMGGLTNAFIKSGGAIIDSNGNAITITQSLLTDVASTGGGLTKQGANNLTLNGANTYTGATTISGGGLDFQKTQSLPGYTTVGGSGAATSIASGGALIVGVGGPGSFTGADVTAIRNNTSGKFTFAGGSSIGIDTTDATTANGNLNNTFTYADPIADTGAGSLGFVKMGANTLAVSSANSYTGATQINGGTLAVAVIANGGTNSDIGASTAASGNLVISGGTLQYTGASATTDRGFTVGGAGATIDNANNLSFAGQILSTGTGSFTKNGAGTLSFTNVTGTNALVGGGSGNNLGFIANAGLVQLGGTPGSPLAQTNTITGELSIGTINSGGSPAAAFEINGGTTTITSYIGVGRGNGTNNAPTSLSINNNAQVTSGNFAIGYSNGVTGYVSSPTVNFSGASSYTDSGVFTVGESVNGTGGMSSINVSGSAAVNLTSISATAVNIGAAGPATMTQSGGTVTSTSVVTIARDVTSTASYNLNGGTLTVPSIKQGAGAGSLNFNGGTLKASAASTTFVTGLTANVLGGGAVIDSNGVAITVPTALVHAGAGAIDGGLTKNGTGSLNLTNTNTYTGATFVNAGTLFVNGSLSATSGVNVASGATLGGNATIAGNSVIASGGFISPGNSVGTISLVNLNVQSGSTYIAELTGNGVNDLVNVSGNLTVNGMIRIMLGYTAQQGDSFDLANFGSFSGTPTFDYSNAALAPGLFWDSSSFTTNGVLSVIPEPSAAALAGLAGALVLVRRRRQRA